LNLLALDTALGAASACVFDSNNAEVLAEERIVLSRGHDLVLLSMLGRVVSVVGFERIDRVAVSVGPGSFTGLRIGIAAAHGVGLSRDLAVVGVSTLSAFAAPAVEQGGDSPIAAVIDMRHGRVCIGVFAPDGRSLTEPAIVSATEVSRLFAKRPVRLVGSAAPLVAVECWQRGVAATVVGETIAPDIRFVARLGALADPDDAPPRPLYIKEPDVALPAGAKA